MEHNPFGRGGTAATVMVSLAIAAGACGGSDDDAGTTPSGNGAGSAAQSGHDETRARQFESGDPKTQLRAIFNQLQDDFRAGKAAVVCSYFTPAAREKTVKNIGGNRYKTCDEAMAAFLDAYADTYVARPKILRVKVDGDRATVLVQSGESTQNGARFLKSSDGWKLDTPLETAFN